MTRSPQRKPRRVTVTDLEGTTMTHDYKYLPVYAYTPAGGTGPVFNPGGMHEAQEWLVNMAHVDAIQPGNDDCLVLHFASGATVYVAGRTLERMGDALNPDDEDYSSQEERERARWIAAQVAYRGPGAPHD